MREIMCWLTAPIGAVAVVAPGSFFMMPASVSSAAPVEDSKISSIAAVGDTAPPSGSPTYSGVDEPMVDDEGNVVFIGFLSNCETGVFFKPKKKERERDFLN